ncbi:hypothetical protein ACUHGC_11680 [Testudinibacter sp. P27/CKL/0425]
MTITATTTKQPHNSVGARDVRLPYKPHFSSAERQKVVHLPTF